MKNWTKNTQRKLLIATEKLLNAFSWYWTFQKTYNEKFIINTIESICFKETPRLSPDHLERVYIEMKISNYSMCTHRAADFAPTPWTVQLCCVTSYPTCNFKSMMYIPGITVLTHKSVPMFWIVVEWCLTGIIQWMFAQSGFQSLTDKCRLQKNAENVSWQTDLPRVIIPLTSNTCTIKET